VSETFGTITFRPNLMRRAAQNAARGLVSSDLVAAGATVPLAKRPDDNELRKLAKFGRVQLPPASDKTSGQNGKTAQAQAAAEPDKSKGQKKSPRRQKGKKRGR
jgi:hypothetical protein